MALGDLHSEPGDVRRQPAFARLAILLLTDAIDSTALPRDAANADPACSVPCRPAGGPAAGRMGDCQARRVRNACQSARRQSHSSRGVRTARVVTTFRWAAAVFLPEFEMLHYSCDMCKRPIDTHDQVRHVVKIEVFAAPDDEEAMREMLDGESLGDADHLDDMQDLLERLDDGVTAESLDDDTRAFRFDLCGECRRRFLRNPLGAKSGKKLDFSNN
jgi:hypothetical protein